MPAMRAKQEETTKEEKDKTERATTTLLPR